MHVSFSIGGFRCVPNKWYQSEIEIARSCRHCNQCGDDDKDRQCEWIHLSRKIMRSGESRIESQFVEVSIALASKHLLEGDRRRNHRDYRSLLD